MRNFLIVSFLVLPITGCALAGGAAVGVVAAPYVTDNHAYASHVEKDAREVWQTTKTFLSEQSKELIQYDDPTRTAKAKIDGSDVTVTVEAWDAGKSVVTVSAKQFMSTVNDGEMAKIVMERLLRRL